MLDIHGSRAFTLKTSNCCDTRVPLTLNDREDEDDQYRAQRIA